MSSRRRNRRSRVVSAGLTETQRSILLQGFDLAEPAALVCLDDEPMRPATNETDKELRRLWSKHRAELMIAPELQPGARPHAFYRFDLDISPAPHHWWEQLQILIDHNLLTPEEAFAVETVRDVLSPKQTFCSFCSGFESTESIQRMGLTEPVLRQVQAEFEAASCWHRSRGRAELANRYALRVGTIDSYLSEVPCETTSGNDR